MRTILRGLCITPTVRLLLAFQALKLHVPILAPYQVKAIQLFQHLILVILTVPIPLGGLIDGVHLVRRDQLIIQLPALAIFQLVQRVQVMTSILVNVSILKMTPAVLLVPIGTLLQVLASVIVQLLH